MKTIHHSNTLFYYDGPQIFEARDAIGGYYIAVLVDSEDTNEQFLIAGVAPERLREFRSGALGLRTLLIQSDDEERYLATVDTDPNHPLVLNNLSTTLMDSGLLPDAGFVLHDRSSDDSVLREAR